MRNDSNRRRPGPRKRRADRGGLFFAREREQPMHYLPAPKRLRTLQTPGTPHLRLDLPNPRPLRFEIRIAATRGRKPFGQSRTFRIHECNLAEILACAQRLEAWQWPAV